MRRNSRILQKGACLSRERSDSVPQPTTDSPAHCPAVTWARQKQVLSQCRACPANLALQLGTLSPESKYGTWQFDGNHFQWGCFLSSFQAGADSLSPEGAHLTAVIRRQQKALRNSVTRRGILCGRPPGTLTIGSLCLLLSDFIDAAGKSFTATNLIFVHGLKTGSSFVRNSPKVMHGIQTVIQCQELINTPIATSSETEKWTWRPPKDDGKFAEFCKQNIYTILKAASTFIYKSKFWKSEYNKPRISSHDRSAEKQFHLRGIWVCLL